MTTEDPKAEVARIEAQLLEIDRFLRRAPWIALSVFLAIPAGILFGGVVALLVATAALTTTGIAIYIPWMRRFEHRRRLTELGVRPTSSSG